MKPWLIKLGGAALTHPDAVRNLAQAIVLLKEKGEDVVVVHGGGPMINKRLTEKNISWTFHEGQRVTTLEMMAEIELALGEVNHMICEIFSENGIKNMGIPGNTNGMFFCRPMDANLGQVGEVIKVNSEIVKDALNMNFVPVIAPIGVDGEGLSYNLNADWGASTLASDLGAKVLIYATDQRGILDCNGLPYDSLTLSQLKILMEKGGVTGGMLAKSRSIEQALLHGVNKVCVTHALEMKELIETRFGGTLCVEMGRLEYAMKMKMTENNYAVS
jgi:acetylglutamate kinase